MKKILFAIGASVLLSATLVLPVVAQAQNIAIVNGKAVPKTRLDTLAQQVAKAGRPVTPEMQMQLREEVIAREVFMNQKPSMAEIGEAKDGSPR